MEYIKTREGFDLLCRIRDGEVLCGIRPGKKLKYSTKEVLQEYLKALRKKYKALSKAEVQANVIQYNMHNR